MDAIPISRWRSAAWALAGAALVAGGVWLARMPAAEFANTRKGMVLLDLLGPTGVHIFFWLATAFFAAGTLVAAIRAMRGGELVRIEADGIRYAGLVGTKLAPWSSIPAVGLYEMSAGLRTQRFIELSPRRRLPLTGTGARLDDVQDWIERANAAHPGR